MASESETNALSIVKGPSAPKHPGAPSLLVQLGIGKNKYQKRADDFREFIDKKILSKYASIADPELRRMTLDVISYMDSEFEAMRSSRESIRKTTPIGSYHLKLPGDSVEVKVRGASSRHDSFATAMLRMTGLNHEMHEIRLLLEDNGRGAASFDNLAKDISMLSRLVPLDYDWPVIGAKKDRIFYRDTDKPFNVGSSNNQEKGVSVSEVRFQMPDCDLHDLQGAVHKIKLAINEPEKILEQGSERRQLG